MSSVSYKSYSTELTDVQLSYAKYASIMCISKHLHLLFFQILCIGLSSSKKALNLTVLTM